MHNSLDSSVAIVTGAAQGMGRATAERLHVDGARVLLVDINPCVTTVARALDHEGIDVSAFVADITESGCAAAIVDAALSRWGRLDILVNAAGVLKPTRVLDISDAEWDRIIAINLTAAFRLTREALTPMRNRRHGRIVNFSSTAGKTVSTLGGCHYTAAKHGLLGITRAVAREVAAYAVTVNAVCPGLIGTGMVVEQLSGEDVQRIAASFPVGRLGRPDEVAALVSFLCSADAAYITGASFDINGGDLMI